MRGVGWVKGRFITQYPLPVRVTRQFSSTAAVLVGAGTVVDLVAYAIGGRTSTVLSKQGFVNSRG